MIEEFVAFEPGERVILRTSWMSSRDKTMHEIKAITKTGKIRLMNGLLFRPDGTRIERGWGIMRLERMV